jgi:signal transduction histidine kinase
VGEQLGRTGRPRRRYLSEQRGRLAMRLVPTLGVLALMSGFAAMSDLLLRSPPVSRLASVGEAFVTILLAGLALGVPMARANFVWLRTLAASAVVVMICGWSFVVATTGKAESEYLLAAPLATIAFFALIPMPSRVALGLGVVDYAAFVLAAPRADVSVHLQVIAIAAAGWVIESTRHRRDLRNFLRVERLGAAVARLRRMQEQLVVVEKLEALRVLVGGMAHELNNALAISAASTAQAQKALANDATNTTRASDAIRRADGGLSRIRRTVDRLRRFAMAAEGTLEPADVGAMLDFALESAIGRARSGVSVDRNYDPEVGSIECHVAALAEALYQVARNAVEAMPGGGTIKASARREGDRVVLVVADEGRGIPPDQLKKVFDPFYQGSPNAQKSGLGLSAVYGLVTALGGTVQIKSDVGRGTEVSISMPAKRVRTTPPPPMTPIRIG